MKPELIQMLKIYKPNGIDWMAYSMTKDNPYTFHHIIEKRNGGKVRVSNGAILTRDAHDLLNVFDMYDVKLYKELNYLFKQLNNSQRPPEEDYWIEVNKIMIKRRFDYGEQRTRFQK